MPYQNLPAQTGKRPMNRYGRLIPHYNYLSSLLYRDYIIFNFSFVPPTQGQFWTDTTTRAPNYPSSQEEWTNKGEAKSRET